MASATNLPDFVVNSFVTNQLKTFTSIGKFKTLRITLNDFKTEVNKLTFCCSTSLSIVTRSGCLLDIQEIIIKSLPKSRKLLKIIPAKKCFENEVFFHREILPQLNDFQADYFQVGERIEAPILKSVCLEEPEEALIFLQAEHWLPTYKKCEGNPNDGEIKSILKQLGKLHGVSYAYTKLKPETTNIWRNKLSDKLLYGFNNENTLSILEKNILEINKKLELRNKSEIAEKLQHMFKSFKKHLIDASSEPSSFQCLLHGDLSSNYLIGYQDNFASKAKLTNWNLIKFGSPVLDLSLFLFTNLDEYIHLDTYLSYYYDSLSKTLDIFGLAISKEYALNQFNEDWVNNREYGIILASLILKLDWNTLNQKLEYLETNIEEFLSCCEAPPADKYLEKISNMIMYCIKNKNMQTC